MTEGTELRDDPRDAVFEAAVRLLDERQQEGFTDVTEWVTGTEIAGVTGIGKRVVLEALTSLGADKLHVRAVEGLAEVEVLGVVHQEQSDALEQFDSDDEPAGAPTTSPSD